MRYPTLRKSGLRKVRSSAARFLSLLLMISLGAFVFVGLLSTAPSLERTLYGYLEAQDKADLTISHPLGLDSKDQALLESLPDLAELVYGQEVQQVVKETGDVLSLESLESLPSYVIYEGRLPEELGEIALAQSLAENYEVGQLLTIDSGPKDEDPLLHTDQFVVTGFVESPDFLSEDFSSYLSAYGDGSLAGFALLAGDVFVSEKPNFARLNFSDVSGLEAGGKVYTERMAVHEDRVKALFRERSPLREYDLTRSANRGLDDADQSLDDAEGRLSSGRRSLDAAQDQIKQGQQLQNQGQAQLNSQEEQGRQTLAQAEEELRQAKQSLEDAERQIAAGEADIIAAERGLEAGRNALAPLENSLREEQKKVDEARVESQKAKRQAVAAQRELEAAQRELAKGQSQLSRAERELQRNQRSLNQGRADAQQAEAALSQGRTALSYAENQVNRLEGQWQSLETAAQEAQRRLTQFERQMTDPSDPKQQSELASLKAAVRQLNSKKQQASSLLSSSRSQVAQEKRSLAQNDAKARQAQSEIESSQRLIDQGQSELRREQAALDSARQELGQAQARFQQESQLLRQADGQLALAQAQLDAGRERLKKESERLTQGQVQLDASRRSLESAKSELLRGRMDLNQGQATLDRERASSAVKLEQGREELASGARDLGQSQAQLNAQRQRYEGDYHENLKSILDQRADVASGRADLRHIQVPAYEIITWTSDPVIDNYAQSAQGMRLMSKIFPAFFYGICLLICLTTMTRMIDDERSEIGTLKGLGYPNSAIMSNYMAYGAFAAIPGTLLGLLGGYFILMPVIVDAYYAGTVFHKTLPVLPPGVPIAALILDLACTSFAAFSAGRIQLQSQVAVLLRPVPPKAGTRIFLERIAPLWSRLNFNQKITFRNLFRYKKRGSLTIVGVAGCMALITMAFGLNYAINGVFERQFSDIQDYDFIALYDDRASSSKQDTLLEELREKPATEASSLARYESAILPMPGSTDQSLSLISPQNPETFQDFVKLRDPDSGRTHDLRDGPILSEKTARVLDLQAGDVLAYETELGEERRLPIAGICENYVGHNLYISPEDYERLLDRPPDPNALYIRTDASEDVDAMAEDFLSSELAFGALKASSSSKQVADLTESLSIVVRVIIVVSVLLALVVLYNLTNINVEERMRELSTIKVLGFYPKEVTAYIYRETFALTLVGIGLGAALGKALHTLIARALAPVSFMMVEVILPQDYLFGILFTLAASFLVMMLMHRKLKHVDMVEALKGVE